MSDSMVDRLANAINSHNIEALVACFAADFAMLWPAHPSRSFSGPDGVRRNWEVLFKTFPDMRAEISNRVHSGDETWGEWEFNGTNTDGGPDFCQRGVIVVKTRGHAIVESRFYMEPVVTEKPAGPGTGPAGPAWAGADRPNEQR